MYTLKITSQFKKDLKKIQNNPTKIKHLKEALELLEQDGVLPEKYKPHKLIGDYVGFMECHIEGDLLLIWLDPEDNIIKLIRLGTHSQLFK
jgi:mRNA interferase YafQ